MVDNQYGRSRHAVYLANYQLVWLAKRKKRILVGAIKARLEAILRQVAREKGWDILDLDIQPDHVHLFVSADPKVAINYIVNAFKGRSSHDLRKEFPELLKLPSLWTHFYFASTAGRVSSATIQKYIEEQTTI
ncbi:MAG: IS200/IS605 family transposase [Thaumarchaeota archaeon]|nr:IS200/IS605 family transposase [Nitrososphaerota archaeon]